MSFSHIFTKLALWSTYNLIRICDGDEWKTAFITPVGHYEYLVLPEGLTKSPSVFQAFMNEVFLHRFVIIYIDDIFIYSWNLAEHRHHVTQVLQNLCEPHLYLKLEKCEFHRDTIHFLGYIIVDAFTSGVGAILSQRQGDPPILHSCAFLSKKLSMTEQNYIGHQKL